MPKADTIDETTLRGLIEQGWCLEITPPSFGTILEGLILIEPRR